MSASKKKAELSGANKGKRANGIEDTQENETCLNEEGRMARFTRAPSSTVRRMTEKLGLETKRSCLIVSLLLCFVFILIIAVIVLALHLPSGPYADDEGTCLEPECLRATAMLRSNFNGSGSPCDDPWGFTCGRWLAENPIPESKSKWSMTQQLRFKAVEEYHRLIYTLPQPMQLDSLDWKLKTFYDSCMNLEYIDSDKAKQLKIEIRQLGGWSVLRDWNINNFDYQTLLQKLHSEYNVEPFFGIQVVSDDRDPLSSIIKITPAVLGLPSREYYFRDPDDPLVKNYHRFLRDSVIELGASGPDAELFAKNIYHLEKRVAEVSPPRVDMENPVRSYNRISIDALSTIASSIPWLSILRAVFPDGNIFPETIVIVSSKKYIQDISSIFYAHDRKGLNDFLMWRLAATLIPYLSDKFRDNVDLFHRQVTGADESKPRWEMCINTMDKYFSLAMGALYSKHILTEKGKSEAVIGEMFEKIKGVLKEEVNDSPYFSGSQRENALAKLNQMTLQVGYPNLFIDDVYLRDYYQLLGVQKNDLYRNVIAGSKFNQQARQRDLINQPLELAWRDRLSHTQISYVHQVNKVVIPEYLLQAPFFHHSYPRSYLYGTMGSLLARAMVESLSDRGVHYSADGSLIFTYQAPNETEEMSHWEEQRTCLRNSFLLSSIGSPAILEKTVNCSLKEIAGVRGAYRALLDSLQAQSERIQPGLPYGPPAIFFLAYGGTQCEVERPERVVWDSPLQQCLPANERMVVTYSQLLSFSHVFSCSSSSTVGQYHKCGRIV